MTMRSLGVVEKDGSIKLKTRSPIDGDLINVNTTMDNVCRHVNRLQQFVQPTLQQISDGSQDIRELPKGTITADIDMIDFRVVQEAGIVYQLSDDQKFVSFKNKADMEYALAKPYRNLKPSH